MDLETYKQDERQAILNYKLTAENDEIADRFQAEFAAQTRPDVAEFLALINQLAAGGTCLDVGSSYGAQYFALKEHYPAVLWVGCELALQFIPKFRERLRDYENPAVVPVENYAQLPFPDNSFDVVTARSVLQHYSPEHGFLIIDEMLRVAKKGVIVKFKIEPSLEEDLYAPILGINAGKGYVVEWAAPKINQYLAGKNYIWVTPRLLLIEK